MQVDCNKKHFWNCQKWILEVALKAIWNDDCFHFTRYEDTIEQHKEHVVVDIKKDKRKAVLNIFANSQQLHEFAAIPRKRHTRLLLNPIWQVLAARRTGKSERADSQYLRAVPVPDAAEEPQPVHRDRRLAAARRSDSRQEATESDPCELAL